MKPEAKVYVSLTEGKCAEVRISIVEEGLPTPHEGCSVREPTVSEMDSVAGRMWGERFTTQPPFPIDRPARPEPTHAEAAAIHDDLSRRYNDSDGTFDPPLHEVQPFLPKARTSRGFWNSIFNR